MAEMFTGTAAAAAASVIVHPVGSFGNETDTGKTGIFDGTNTWSTLPTGWKFVPQSRTISTTSPLTGGGDLSANRTIAIPAATTSVNGYLTSTDWNTFNGKLPVLSPHPQRRMNLEQMAGYDKGLLISGDEYYSTGNGDATHGVALLLGVNRSSNRQLWIGDLDALGSSTLGFFRCQTGGLVPNIDAVTGDGATGLPLAIGTGTTNVLIGGNGSYPYYFIPASKLTVAGNVTVGGSLTGTAAPTNGLLVQGDAKFNAHLVGNSSTPGIAAGVGAGTTPTLAIVGTDIAGKITLTSGTLPTAASTIFTVTFATAYGAAPYVAFSPGNANAAALSGLTAVYVTSTTTTFVFSSGATGLTAALQFIWYFKVAG